VSGFRLVGSSLSLRLGGRLLLSELDLEVSPGEVVGIVGPSGTGKTSLLLVLSKVIEPDSGEVRYEAAPGESRGQPRLGLVPQSIGLAGDLTAAENVALPLQVLGMGRDEMRERCEKMLSDLGLVPAIDRLVTELSGGQRQRVAVARALAGEPDILLADEATAELDGEHQAIVMGLFEQAASSGATVVLSTHDELVADRCSRVFNLEEGQLVATTSPEAAER
jgi:putative ABC transport system ATP-binding protein